MYRLRTGITYLTLPTVAAVTLFIAPSLSGSQVLAQTAVSRRVEADRLNQQGIDLFNNRQFGTALQSFQQAMTIYRAIGDRKSEGYTLANLGVAYDTLGDYPKAIEYELQWLAIARETGERESESKALESLGNAYADLGDMARASAYYQQNYALTKLIHNPKANQRQASDRQSSK
jgi:tetratricopeptide (TPR) repeat protein